jgi:hydroxymethylbilane synthase
MTNSLTIGSRGSQLALWQSNWVKTQLERHGFAVAIEIIQTTGDKITDVSLSKIGAKGLFTKEIEEALLDGRVDLAVHSCKDMPTELPTGLVLSAIPVREDPRDVVVGRKIAELPPGATVGTSSLRRAAQLYALRPDLRVETIRGNVDTRLRKQREGQYDSIILAAAGLHRLGLGTHIAEYLDPEQMMPAVAQGALAIETQSSGAGFDAARLLDDPATRLCVTAERAALRSLGGGCQVPIGAHATLASGQLTLHGLCVSPDGSLVFRATTTGSDPDAVGTELGERLLNAGARMILDQVYGA